MGSMSRRLVSKETVIPGVAGSGEVRKGQILRIVDLEGQQVADFTSFRLDDPAECCDVLYSAMYQETWRLAEGHVLYTKDMRPLWTIVTDPVGVHYSGGSFCSRPLLRDVYGVDMPGCRDCLEAELRRRGIPELYLNPASCFNVFMNYVYGADGRMWIEEPVTKPGDFVELRAEMDALWVASACPGPGPCNGDNPTPLLFECYDDRSSDSD